jgi:hypothetical protein
MTKSMNCGRNLRRLGFLTALERHRIGCVFISEHFAVDGVWRAAGERRVWSTSENVAPSNSDVRVALSINITQVIMT